jgi:hypothetical protein
MRFCVFILGEVFAKLFEQTTHSNMPSALLVSEFCECHILLLDGALTAFCLSNVGGSSASQKSANRFENCQIGKRMTSLLNHLPCDSIT